MKTPIEFDYDLWTTEDGKCMVRVKATGEETEVDRELMRFLRAEEKRLRRSLQSESGLKPKEKADADEQDDNRKGSSDKMLSLDFISYDGEDAENITTIPWTEDPQKMEDAVIFSVMEEEFRKTLTAKQLDLYIHCLKNEEQLRAYARLRGIDVRAAFETKKAVMKKMQKFFAVTLNKRV